MMNDPPVPQEFLEDVAAAAMRGEVGKLLLFADEIRQLPWGNAGLEHVSEALLAARALQLRAGHPMHESSFSYTRAVVFSGVRADSPDRLSPRFPEDFVPRVGASITAALREQRPGESGSIVGLAGAASGGDLLFHESCAALGIASRVLLALPPEQYVALSVAPAGEAWTRRFELLMRRHGGTPVQVLRDTEQVPAWLGAHGSDNVFQRVNRWLLQEACALAPSQVVLALWDGKSGDGQGGTASMVELAERSRIEVKRIEVKRIDVDLRQSAADHAT